jgi:hypothetical protein
MRLLPTVGALLVAALGCSDPDTLTCEWLASADNCWSNTAQLATSCLPASADSGLFSADNSSCSYTSGSAVNFTPAIVLPLNTNAPWNFTVNDGTGLACLHFEESGASMRLVVRGQTVTVGGSGLEETIHCPDGTSVKNSNAFNLLSCPGSISSIPGQFTGYTDTSVSFSLIGMSDGSTLSVFDCSKS